MACAAYLARAGVKTLVLERRELIGGAAVSEGVWPGWKVSTASYVCSLLHPRITNELKLASFGYDAYVKDPHSFNPLADGRSLLLSSNDEQNEKEIAAFCTRDVEGFKAFDRRASALGTSVYDAMLLADDQLAAAGRSLKAAYAESAAQLVERYVETPVLQAALVNDGLVGTFAGPKTPGTAHVLAHHYAGRAFGRQGAWGYVRGGMGSVSQALAAAARAAGADIATQSDVAAITVCRNRSTGVVLGDGTELEARAILSNADPKTTFLKLTPPGVFRDDFIERVRGWRCEGVSLKVNLALGELPEFAARPTRGRPGPHHRASIHIAPTVDYLQDAYEDARGGNDSRAPLLECFLQTPTDPTIAPAGKHLLSIFAQYFPYGKEPGAWTDRRRELAADTVVNALAPFAPNVPNAIEGRQVLAPPDLEQRFGLWGGHIFHGELLPDQIFDKRFGSRTPLRGLYLCGSGAHPGGCVSGAPGMRAAQATIADLKTGLL
ncbi:MAG: NAD(P)/FAD-dependent oxidoreductase [Candidatus Eremiobacteraeota bacterium]|nr:NAD(P)/FAD-dependent oxidoreductase [Candidatus Eremiobacteraeota bacterium]